MTHQEFINKWNNKPQERRDKTNRNQCFDLVVGYVHDVFEEPLDTFSGLLFARFIWERPTRKTGKMFDFIKNQPWAIPKQGDIIVWSGEYNPYLEYGRKKLGAGHTAVIDKADINNFTAFSQNDPTGSVCTMKNYNYDHILGWLRHITHSVAVEEVEKLKQKIHDLEETEKRKDREHKKALSDKDKEFKQKLAEQEAECQQKRKESINKIITLAQSLS